MRMVFVLVANITLVIFETKLALFSDYSVFMTHKNESIITTRHRSPRFLGFFS